MKINKRYCELVKLVNNSKDEEEHAQRLEYLLAWVNGVKFSKGFISEQMANAECAEGHPVVAGVWQDWKPK